MLCGYLINEPNIVFLIIIVVFVVVVSVVVIEGTVHGCLPRRHHLHVSDVTIQDAGHHSCTQTHLVDMSGYNKQTNKQIGDVGYG